MKSLARGIFLGAMIVFVPFSLQAQTRRMERTGGSKTFLRGSNIYGKTGLFFAETAQTQPAATASGVLHGLFGFDDNFNSIQIPLGVNYGIVQNFEGAMSLSFDWIDPDAPRAETRNGIGSIRFGGKYVYDVPDQTMPDVGVSLDIAHGPLSDDLGEDGTDFDLEGLVTHTFSTGFLLNGGLGVLIEGDRGADDGDTAVRFNVGAGIPITPNLSGIAELAINRFGEDDGIFAFGIRAQGPVQCQVFFGVGVGDASADISLGGGVRFGR